MNNSSGTFFDGFADTFDTFYDGKRRPLMQWIDRRFRSDMFLRFEMAFAVLGELKDKSVLDIGCGSGPYLTEALRRGASRVTGIDPAPRMLELTRERMERLNLSEKVTLIEGYFPQTRPAAKHDCAIVMGVMDYVEDASGFVRSLHEIVTGRAAVSFPSTHWFRTPFRQVRYKARRCPVYFYTPAKIHSIMEAAGVGAQAYRIEKIPGAGMDFVVCLKT